jgi:hypothetical protein
MTMELQFQRRLWPFAAAFSFELLIMPTTIAIECSKTLCGSLNNFVLNNLLVTTFESYMTVLVDTGSYIVHS